MFQCWLVTGDEEEWADISSYRSWVTQVRPECHDDTYHMFYPFWYQIKAIETFQFEIVSMWALSLILALWTIAPPAHSRQQILKPISHKTSLFPLYLQNLRPPSCVEWNNLGVIPLTGGFLQGGGRRARHASAAPVVGYQRKQPQPFLLELCLMNYQIT